MNRIKRVLAVLLLVGLSTALYAQNPATSTLATQKATEYLANMPADSYKISEAAFIEKVKAGENIMILDIRQAADYNKGHVKGAVNAPFGPDMGSFLDKLPKDKPVMLYCYTGQTAGQTVVLLNLAGVQARSVNLGFTLGISKVSGVEAYIETTARAFPAAGATYDPALKKIFADYFAGLAKVNGTIYANNIIAEDEAKKLIDAKDPSIQVVSVRGAADYAKGHIKGAINVPWGKGMQAGFSVLPKNKKLIVYCYTGQTAGQTVAALRVMGYDAVSLRGGMGMPSNAPSGWANKGFPVVTD
ncbi:MAG TPA: rhodanese-like domain-containing protein [bacterium]|nr:rhodanese-like domain-containing protein [bacterium]